MSKEKLKLDPSGIALRALKWFCPDHLYEEIEGDLIQKFERDVGEVGERKAKRRFMWNVIRFFRPEIVVRNRFQIQFKFGYMLENYLKVACRRIVRSKLFSTISIAGLALGMICAVLIFLWIKNETSYDQFHPDSNRLYKAWNRAESDGQLQCWSVTPKILVSALKAERPEVEEAVSYADWKMDFLFIVNEVRITANTGSVTESKFLSLFNFPLLSGNPISALDDPSSIVLTENFAKRLFGDKSALGKNLVIGYEGNKMDFVVSGVLKSLPDNTSFQFDYLISWELFKQIGEEDTSWGNNSVSTYVRLKPEVAEVGVNSKIKDIVKRHSLDNEANEVFLYPVSKSRLYSKFTNGQPDGGRIEVVRLMGVLAIFILLISGINFVNLSTAKSEDRSKEVGIRKTLGARKQSLVEQFLGESILTAIIAGAISLIGVQLSLPLFNVLTEKALTIDYANYWYWLGAVGMIAFVGLMAGIYPAFLLSSVRPIAGIKKTRLSRVTVRRTLVVFQFSFTILLVIAILVVQQQIDFAQRREIGYTKDHLIYHPITGSISQNYVAYKNELLNSGIATSITRTFSPVTELWSNTAGISWAGKDPQAKITFDRYPTDEDLVKTLGLQIIEGRDMDLEKFPTDSSAALINQSALHVMGFKNPIGETFSDNDKDWIIVGVVKDFVAQSPFSPVKPMVIEGSRMGWFDVIHIRIQNDVPIDQALADIGVIFKKYNPEYPFEYHFVDQEFDRKFNDERRIQRMTLIGGSLTIFISCLGVLGLSIYMAQQRVKEIGVRKVFGASVLQIMMMLSREPVKLITIAFVIVVPVSYWAVGKWLENYSYRVDIHWTVFAIAGILALVLALVTISVQTIRSALQNPVDSLKYE